MSQPDDDIDAAEAPHVDDLCKVFVEVASFLGVPEWLRTAITSSIESGWVREIVKRALREAHRRGQRDMEHPTPVMELPSSPPGVGVSYDDPPRPRTSNGFPGPRLD